MSELLAKVVEQSGLPLIDVADLRAQDPGRRRAIGRRLRAACMDKGFFYIANHGVSERLIERAFSATEDFFALPEHDKRRIDKALSRCNRGYEPLRGQTLEPDAPPDVKEGFYIGNELCDDHPYVKAGKFNHGANQWPQNLPRFRPAMEAYFDAMRDLSLLLVKGLALSLELDENYFDSLCTDSMETLRLLHYPPQPANPLPNEKGCGAHTDFGALTLLAQDQAGGLQVYDAQHGWVHAPPIPGTFLVNLGDLTARWTNGMYRSTLHRVVNISGRERYSIPFFFSGNIDYVVNCLPTCASPENPPKHPPLTIEQHFIECFSRTYK
ncbi:MAG: Isopenicillin synthase-related dioxygenase [Herbaspirillum sp.]|jgi:isopenicillin N synthase-like dioxygenase|nr:Isopenicillin synthase-related dioxygenase [Herbaspirillum sp.]